MEQTQNTHPRIKQKRSIFLHYIAPGFLLLTTILTLLLAGMYLSIEFLEDGQLNVGDSIRRGLPFAGAMLFILSAHAFGHYITARRHHVQAYFPYFIPNIGLYGSSGAYTKLSWPIHDRQALIKIFTIGPLAGFCVSWGCFAIGLWLSQVIEISPDAGLSHSLGNSLMTLVTQWGIHGKLSENHDILLHPVGFAGWIGLHYNMWHLLPIGKLDGGRIIYAFWGYRTTKWASGICIGLLVILSLFWQGWIVFVVLGLLSMTRLRAQYPSDSYTTPLHPLAYYLGFGALTVFLVSFVPIPFLLQ